MKKILFTLYALTWFLPTQAQVSPKLLREIRNTTTDSRPRVAPLSPSPASSDKIGTNGGLISDTAFARLMKQDVSFIILGSQSPTPGFSLDLSNDLSVKITGQAPTKKGILTIDVTASRVDTDIPIFAEDKFNGKLSAGLNFHYIPKGVLRISKQPLLQFGTYTYDTADKALVNELTTLENIRLRTTLIDSIAVLSAYAKIAFPTGLAAVGNDIQSQKAIDLALPQVINTPEDSVLARASIGSRELLFLKLAGKYVALSKSYTDVRELIDSLQSSRIRQTENWQVEKLLSDLQRLARSYNDLEDVKFDKEVVRSRPYWLRKQLQWFTFSAKPVLYTVNTYETDTLKKAINSSTMNFVEVEIPIWYQLYDIGVKGGNLLRFGVNFIVGTNREEYRKVSYSTNDNIATYLPYGLAEQKKEEGIYVR